MIEPVSWDRLRSEQRLGRERAVAALEAGALAIARELSAND